MKVKVIKMANTNKRYEPEFKKKMVRLVLEEGRTIASVNKEYNLGEGTVRSWIRQFEEECEKNPEIKETKDIYEENRRLRKKLECQTAHCGRYIPHFDFSAKPSPIVPYRHLPQSLSGMTADCRSLV